MTLLWVAEDAHSHAEPTLRSTQYGAQSADPSTEHGAHAQGRSGCEAVMERRVGRFSSSLHVPEERSRGRPGQLGRGGRAPSTDVRISSHLVCWTFRTYRQMHAYVCAWFVGGTGQKGREWPRVRAVGRPPGLTAGVPRPVASTPCPFFFFLSLHPAADRGRSR